MRYAVISDIHANRQALKAVLADIDNAGADRIVCLGDIVGYGPSPKAVMDMLRARTDHFVLGNHDAVPAGYITSDNFNMTASRVIDWTCDRLDKDAVEFLKSLPLTLVGSNIRFSHAEFEHPARFGYTDDEKSALAAFNSCNDSLLLVGHSHIPGIFVIGNSGIPHWLKPQDFGFEEHKRYIVNVGSIGQPRDNDSRASYCIIDDEVNDVLFRKVEFDIGQYKNALQRNNLPAVSSFLFLAEHTAEPPPVPVSAKSAESDDFTPLSKKDTDRIQQQIQNLQQTVTELRRSRKTLLSLVLILTLAVVAIPTLFLMRKDRPLAPQNYIVAATSLQLPAETSEKIKNCEELLSMPVEKITVTESSPLKYWNITLTDPDNQNISVIEITDSKKKEMPAFYVKSEICKPLIISSFAVPAEKGMRFAATAQFKPDNIESGLVEIRLKQQFPDGTEKVLLSREPKNLAESAKWVPTSVTIPTKEPITRRSKIIMEIFCNIKGGVKIRKCSLKRKK